MGQSPSAPIAGRSKTFMRRSFRARFGRGHHSSQGTLSATYNYVDNDLKVNQLNLNLASEEELMTLPGISRAIARNIVEYRQQIGRFNKVEDLALVSGVGANKLDEIRPEICVAKRKSHGFLNYTCDSNESLTSTEMSPLNNNHRLPMDVNSATVFQLMAIRGINQELAASIVEYRERRGDFFTLDDLLKVKGMNQVRLSSLRPKLTVKSGCRFDRIKSSGDTKLNGKLPEPKPKSSCNGVAMKDVYELVSSYSHRPPYVDVDLPKTSIRVASWNMSNLNKDKAENPAVREVVSLTILENKLSFIAFQGIEDSEALEMLCGELRTPVSKRVLEWKGPRGSWFSKYVALRSGNGSHNLGFLYNAHLVCVNSVKAVQDNSMIRAAQVNLTFHGSTVDLLNVEVLSNSGETHFSTLLASFKPSIVFGDFSDIKKNDKASLCGYRPLLKASTQTKQTNSTNCAFYDNIYIKESAINLYSGLCNVIRGGLSHLAIPNGWHWNGSVSDHCPVWAQLTSSPSSSS